MFDRLILTSSAKHTLGVASMCGVGTYCFLNETPKLLRFKDICLVAASVIDLLNICSCYCMICLEERKKCHHFM